MLTKVESKKIPDLVSASKLVVTTSVGKRAPLIDDALRISETLGISYVARLNKGLNWVLESSGAEKVLIVEASGLALAHRDGTTYRYHPNLGLIRALNMLRGQRDLFADAVELEPGDRILDCTVGFGCEAILAAILVGDKGRVVGLESVPELALMTGRGLQERPMTQKKLIAPMRKVEVVCADYRDFVRNLKPGEFDVIYFDPFFHERIDGSEINIDPLMRFGNPATLDVDSIHAATQVAGKRVVLKHPRDQKLPGGLEDIRTQFVMRAHGPIAYSVFRI